MRRYNFKDSKLPYGFIIKTVIVLFVISLFFVGCANNKKLDTISQVCEDGYLYNVIEGSYKKIVVQNGNFRTCESGFITIREF